MKTVLIASLLVATTFAASAMSGSHLMGSNKQAAAGPDKTRIEVMAELQAAKAAGLFNISDSEMRDAERANIMNIRSNLTRQQVQQEVIALRKQGLLDIQGDH